MTILIKPWTSQKLIELIDIRRKYKNLKTDVGQNEYRKYRNLVNREPRKTIRIWQDNTCTTINNYLKKVLGDKA